MKAGRLFRVLISARSAAQSQGGHYAEILAAAGAFTAGGHTNLNTPVGVLHFPHGSVKAFPHATATVTQVNRHTCLMTIVQRGTYRLGHGTGKYAHLTGHGRYVAHILAVLNRTRKGKCSQSKRPQALQQVINAHGPVRGV